MGIGLFTLTWASAVAFGRVQYGAHFPTDVVFSIGFGLALAPPGPHGTRKRRTARQRRDSPQYPLVQRTLAG